MKLDEYISKLFSKKLDKKSLKQNFLVKLALMLRHQIVTNSKFVLVLISSIVLLIIFIIIFLGIHDKKEKEANLLLDRAVNTYRYGYYSPKLSNEERQNAIQQSLNIFENVIRNFKSTSAKDTAFMYQGNIYYEARDYNRALQKYQNLIDDNPKYYFADYIMINIAKCHEQLGNYQQAIDTYNKIIKDYSQKPGAALAMLNLGQLYEVNNQYKDASDQYQNLMNRASELRQQNIWAQEARKRLLYFQTLGAVQPIQK